MGRREVPEIGGCGGDDDDRRFSDRERDRAANVSSSSSSDEDEIGGRRRRARLLRDGVEVADEVVLPDSDPEPDTLRERRFLDPD
jgi:hypothetical protein